MAHINIPLNKIMSELKEKLNQERKYWWFLLLEVIKLESTLANQETVISCANNSGILSWEQFLMMNQRSKLLEILFDLRNILGKLIYSKKN